MFCQVCGDRITDDNRGRDEPVPICRGCDLELAETWPTYQPLCLEAHCTEPQYANSVCFTHWRQERREGRS